MLYYRYGPDRIFYFREEYVITPLVILVEFLTFYYIKRLKTRAIELEKLKLEAQELENRIRLYKISMVGLGSITGALLIKTGRGGDDEIIIDVGDLRCGIREGFSYLETKNVQKKIVALFKNKVRNGVILITASAVCQFIKIHGMENLIIQGIGEHFGIIYPQQWGRTTANSVVLGTGIVGLVLSFIINQTAFRIVAPFLIGVGLHMISNSNGVVETTPINIQEIVGKDHLLLSSRKPNEVDVIVINLPSPNFNIKLFKENPECVLMDHKLFNKNCKLSLNVDELEFRVKSDDIVKMKDVLSLETAENLIFSDEQQLKNLPSIEPRWKKSSNDKSRKKLPPAKTVKFSEKFSDTSQDRYRSENEDNTRYQKDNSNREKVKVKENFTPD